jgi:hypothetical protein
MTDTITARHQLPFLAVGQAQKETTHNEALLRIDMLLHPNIEAQLSAPPIGLGEAQAGSCWLIGASPTSVWQNKAGQIACWTGGSWRYLAPVEGMVLRNKASGIDLTYTNASWMAPSAIANPTGGSVVDTQARTAISAILTLLRTTGKIAF